MNLIYFETNFGVSSIQLDPPKTLLQLVLETGLSSASRNNGKYAHMIFYKLLNQVKHIYPHKSANLDDRIMSYPCHFPLL